MLIRAPVQPRSQTSAVQILALVSGLPKGVRERRLMMVLQAFVDDSGEQDDKVNPVFVLAGFIADSSRWADFSTEWQKVLESEPPIDYFKMREADRLDGEFNRHKGWTAEKRDQKLATLIPIIAKHVGLRIAISIDKAAYAKHIRTIPSPSRTSIIDKPYFLAFHNLVLGVAGAQYLYGFSSPCDFIFDEQGSVGDDAVATWDSLKLECQKLAEAGRTDFRPFLGSKPIFRDEKAFNPLQAADFYAWQVRRLFYDNRALTVPQRKELRAISHIPAITFHLGAEQLKGHRMGLLSAAARHVAQNPNAVMEEFKGSKKAQKRVRVAKKNARILRP